MIIERIERWKKWMTTLLLLLCLSLCAVLFKAYLDGKFDSVEMFQSYISEFGLLAPVVLVVIQQSLYWGNHGVFWRTVFSLLLFKE